MCDTILLRKEGVTFFAKNSDREPGEAQLVVRIPAVANDRSRRLTTTYIEIGQVPDRHGVILSKPFWIWGAEMGANDCGVVIGNEAVFSRLVDKTPGLIGMDLLRLGLERGDTAEHALHVITGLLEQYGQGGACGYRDKHFYYDNSFIIADSRQAWILETAGRHWAARRIDNAGAISNCLTIGSDYDMLSDGAADFARQKGWLKKHEEFNFKRVFDTWFLPFFGASHKRLALSRTCLAQTGKQPTISLGDMTQILRRHADSDSVPDGGSNADICMHAGGIIRRSQTCGSMVSRLTEGGALHLVTGTSAPCLSLFKPVDHASSGPFFVLNPDERTVAGSIWEQHEAIHRRLLFDDKNRQSLQKSIAEAEAAIFSIFENADFMPSESDFMTVDRLVREYHNQWRKRYAALPFRYPKLSLYGLFWKRMNRSDGFS